MPLLAIIGAGPGLGLALARRFGREGFEIALLARHQRAIDQLSATLADESISARGYAADVTDPNSLAEALRAIERDLGPIDVLEYSPAPAGPDSHALAPVRATDLTINAVAPQVAFYLYGGITAVQAVLPQMRRRRNGTILVTTGVSAGPTLYPQYGSVATASAALRNWVLNLNEALFAEGVYVAHISIAAWIGRGGPDSDPDRIAEQYWILYRERTERELFWADAHVAVKD